MLNAQIGEPRFHWVGSPTPIHMGERGELIFEITGLASGAPPPIGIFSGRAPSNAILNEGPPAEENGVYRYTLTLIPLEERNIVLAPFTFADGPFSIAVLGLNVQIRPPIEIEQDSFDDALVSEDFLSSGYLAFPAYDEDVPTILRGEYERIIAAVNSLWEERLFAEALAELRRNERDSLAGPHLVSLRREVEQTLGLGFTENEKWRPFGIPLITYVFLLIAALSTGAFFFVFGPRQAARRKVISLGNRKGYLAIVISVLLVGLTFILLEEGLGNLPVGRFRSPGKPAVLRRTEGYRVPDFRGVVNNRFDEGQPVIVIDHRYDWFYAEAPDGRSGWVPSEAVITY